MISCQPSKLNYFSEIDSSPVLRINKRDRCLSLEKNDRPFLNYHVLVAGVIIKIRDYNLQHQQTSGQAICRNASNDTLIPVDVWRAAKVNFQKQIVRFCGRDSSFGARQSRR